MDNMAISFDTPAEDELATNVLTGACPVSACEWNCKASAAKVCPSVCLLKRSVAASMSDRDQVMPTQFL